MSKKTFSTAPRPKPPTEEQLLAYERGGTGHDTHRIGSQTTEPVPPAGKIKRLSIDLPEHLHMRFKTACSATGKKMGDELKDYIDRRTTELEAQAGLNHKTT